MKSPSCKTYPKPASRNRYKHRRTGNAGQFFSRCIGFVWKGGKFVFSGVSILILVGVLSLGLVLGYQYLVNSPYFMVRKVVLNGLNRIPRADVLSRAGLDKPANILALKLDAAAENLKSLPWAENVTITRKLPDTIIVDIRERKPTALISLGPLYYLDETGRPFKKVAPGEKPELPIITGLTKEDMRDGRQFAQEDIRDIFALLEATVSRNDDFRLENISEVNFDAVRGLSLFTRDANVQVKVGFGDYQTKMQRLGRVMAHLKINGEYENVVYLNLENSPRVVVRQG